MFKTSLDQTKRSLKKSESTKRLRHNCVQHISSKREKENEKQAKEAEVYKLLRFDPTKQFMDLKLSAHVLY